MPYYHNMFTGQLDLTVESGSAPTASDGFVTLASLGTLLVTYEDEFISHNGDPVYIQTE